EAVRATAGPLDVVSDSTYVVNCFRDRWWEGWLKRDWLNSQKKPVANRDLWEPLIELVNARAGGPNRVTFRWVKGHSEDPMNDLVVLTGLGLGAEQLAAEAAVAADVPFVAVLPFPDQESVWSEGLKHRYRELVERAADVRTITAKKPESRTAALGALARRNGW